MVPAMSSGWRRLLSIHRVARSTRRRECRRILVCARAETLVSRPSISAQISSRPNTARAAVWVRAISSYVAPVSSRRRNAKVQPPRLIVSLTIRVVMISRRRAWASIASPKRARRALGKYSWRAVRKYGSSGSSVASSSSARVILV